MNIRVMLLGLLALSACASVGLRRAPKLSSDDQRALIEAADEFYRAQTYARMNQALERAKALGPQSAVYHELAARLAQLQDDQSARLFHLMQALQCADNDAAPLHLELLARASWPLQKRASIEALLEAIEASHPEQAVRIKARHMLADSLHHRGKDSASLRARRGALGLSVVGAWSNEEGRAFKLPHPPEQRIEPEGRYDGALVGVGWREPPTSTFGPDLEMSGLFAPDQWALAYAAASFKLPIAGRYMLRLDSSVPVRVWVNDQLIFEIKRVQGFLFDQFILPVELMAGVNRVLIKSAQDQGPWRLSARISRPDGSLVPELVTLPLSARIAEDSGPQRAPPRIELRSLLEARVQNVQGGLRRDFHQLRWAQLIGLRSTAMGLSDRFLSRAPNSAHGGFEAVRIQWANKKRNTAERALSALLQQAPEPLAFQLLKSRILSSSGRKRAARKMLKALLKVHPKAPGPRRALARLYKALGWSEDRCAALLQAEALRPGALSVLRALADCYEELGLLEEAMGVYDRILSTLPNDLSALEGRLKLALNGAQTDDAVRWADRLTASAPHLSWTWRRLGEAHRRRSDRTGAEAALFQAAQIEPDNASVWRELGQVALQNGDPAAARSRWEAALIRDPNDGRLMERLESFQTPEKSPWLKDVPNANTIRAALHKASAPDRARAHLVDLLDHELTLITRKNRVTNWVTQVVQIVTREGAAQMSRLPLRPGGDVRVMKAFALTPQGRRVKASIRRRVVHFEGLKAGAVVVLQYRQSNRAKPSPEAGVGRGWWFQAPKRNMAHSEWVVWMPTDRKHHEWVRGKVERKSSEKGGFRRLAWTAKHSEALPMEAGMPAPSEVAKNMLFSTFPSWEAWAAKDRQALSAALQPDAQMKLLAQRVLKDAKTPAERVERIHRYLLKEVRTHPKAEPLEQTRFDAPVRVARRAHGDAKDKAALFIALAREAGVKAHFALGRSRFKGPTIPSVPMQQFDRALVYVPAQKGLEARFFDPSVEHLELSALPAVLPGTVALVLLPDKVLWERIPLQPAQVHRQTIRARLMLDKQGGARGRLELESTGRYGAMMRRMVAEPKRLASTIQSYAARLLRRAVLGRRTVDAVEDLERPVQVGVELRSARIGQRDPMNRDVLLLSLPKVWSGEAMFKAPQRYHPIELGVPFALRWYTEISTPLGTTIEKIPKSKTIKSACFELVRKISQKGQRLIVDQRFRTTCDRISVDKYIDHRDAAQKIEALYKDKLVVRLAGAGAKL